jgi:ankyrin repeat protein
VIAYLVKEENVFVNCRTTHQETPLMLACKENQSKAVELLIQLGGYIHAVNQAGYTCLHYIAESDHFQILRVLINIFQPMIEIPSILVKNRVNTANLSNVIPLEFSKKPASSTTGVNRSLRSSQLINNNHTPNTSIHSSSSYILQQPQKQQHNRVPEESILKTIGKEANYGEDNNIDDVDGDDDELTDDNDYEVEDDDSDDDNEYDDDEYDSDINIDQMDHHHHSNKILSTRHFTYGHELRSYSYDDNDENQNDEDGNYYQHQQYDHFVHIPLKKIKHLLLKTEGGRFFLSVLHQQGKNGMTALHLACQMKSIRTAELLAKCGSSVNIQDKMKETPLHKAARTLCRELYGILVNDYHAKETMKNSFYQTPRQLLYDDLNGNE